MTPVTDQQWEAYRLCHPDHESLSYEKAAEQMGIPEIEVARILSAMEFNNPDLFTDISSDGCRFDYGMVQYGSWCDNKVKERF